MGNPFGDDNETTAVATEVQEPDADLDVDAGTDDGTEEVPETPPTKPGTKAKAEPKEKKEPARKPVAEGYITPVDAAKKLSEHLTAKAQESGAIGTNEKIEIRPQIVYATLKSNGEKSRNPIPQYTDPALTGGRQCVLKLGEFLAWWDAKDERVASRKVKKVEAPAEAPTEADNSSVAEAE